MDSLYLTFLNLLHFSGLHSSIKCSVPRTKQHERHTSNSSDPLNVEAIIRLPLFVSPPTHSPVLSACDTKALR